MTDPEQAELPNVSSNVSSTDTPAHGHPPTAGMPAAGMPVAMHKITVARTARYAVVGAAPARAARLWIAFHGYAHRAEDFVAPFAESVPTDTRVIAPEGLSRFYLEMPRPDGGHLTRTGASWLTRDDRDDELRDALAMLHSVVAREVTDVAAARGQTPAIGVLGFSQGVAMSMRWVADAANNPALGQHTPVSAHVLWAGGLAHDVSDDSLRAGWKHTQVHVVAGERDKFASDTTRASLRTRLSSIGVKSHEHSFDGGHRLDTLLLATLLRQLHTA